MDQERHNNSLSNSSGSRAKQRQLFALIGEDSLEMKPYRSKFQMKSIGSGSRASRDSDLLNRLCQDQSKSSKSLSRNVSNTQLNKSLMNSSSNSILSDRGSNGIKNECKNQSGSSVDIKNQNKMLEVKQAPKIHNCVCFVAGECLSYNCNCFLSPFPCAPQCCPSCLTLKSGLPHKISNMCSCKKTKCLKLYCECLSKGQFCSVMCRCELCENHEHSKNRVNSLNNMTMFSGCSCPKNRCIKKYCECYAQGIKCTRKCICIGCKNFIEEKQDKPKTKQNEKLPIHPNLNKIQAQEMDIEFEEVDFYSGKRLG